jgi:hypothetical protein
VGPRTGLYGMEKTSYPCRESNCSPQPVALPTALFPFYSVFSNRLLFVYDMLRVLLVNIVFPDIVLAYVMLGAGIAQSV